MLPQLGRPFSVARAHSLALGLIGIVCVELGVPRPAAAQNPPTAPVTTASIVPPPDAGARRQATATQLNGAAIKLDGQLDEAIWSTAPHIADFIQKDPLEAQPAATPTEVRFLYDGDALYIGARMRSQGRKDIQAPSSRRDNPGNAERLIVALDSYHDRRTAYSFGVTAAGTRFEYYHSSDDEYNRDYSFNPVWEARAHIDSTGWTAEMRIPFSQLRFNAGDAQVWGLNLNRYIPSRNEDDYWVYVPKNETGWSSRFGDLVGISGIRPTRRLELLPYLATNSTITGDPDPADPFTDRFSVNTRVGGDLKMGLGPNLTLDATINPDFGQVDADPAIVNLSAVEVFFEERRPFFTEGSQLLAGDGPGYYYSRRIGAPPRGDAEGDYVDVPPASTILGAAKVTGRLPSGTSIGFLAALTDAEVARTYDLASSTFSDVDVAPTSGYGVARVQQEFGRNQSTIGAMVTGVRRNIDRSSPLNSLLTHDAVSGGIDWNLRSKGGVYSLRGSLGASYIAGDSTALLGIQNNATHRFQRPDQDHVSLDSSRTSLKGWAASLEFDKNSGKHWLYTLEVAAESPGFEINDAGRLGTADDIDGFGSLRYRENRPGKFYQNYQLAAYGLVGWNFGGIRQYMGIDFEANMQFKNFMNAFVSFERFPSSLADDLTRGGPLMSTSSDWNINGGFNSAFAAKTRWRSFIIYGEDNQGGSFFNVEGGITIQPSPRWEFSANPFFGRSINARQYIDQLPNGPSATYGTRYIFGRVSRTTISTQFRLNYSITPDLTVELYAEPFVASGQYTAIGELRQPRTDSLRFYGSDGSTISQDEDGVFTVNDGADSFQLEPDFHVLSFRSNLVLRWEWRPGSTLFLVWQQNRGEDADPLTRSSMGDYFSSFRAAGDNLLAVKVSYWIPIR